MEYARNYGWTSLFVRLKQDNVLGNSSLIPGTRPGTSEKPQKDETRPAPGR